MTKVKDRFVKVPLWWITGVAKATKTPKILVAVELLHLSWEHGGATVDLPLSNARLAKMGVSREVKRRALRELEQAGFITISRQPGRATRVSLVVL